MVGTSVPLALIPLLPFAGFLFNGVFGRKVSKSVSGLVACLAIGGAFVVAALNVWSLVQQPVEQRIIEQTVFWWISSGDLQLPLQFRLDPLGALMVLVVSGIGTLIHVYSTAYMHEEADGEYARYFSYLNLFAAFMLVLVLGANFPVMFVGWEGVGLCSYLLIGFWFKKKSASDAGKKAFVVNRIGDFAFLIGMFMAFKEFGTLDFLAIAEKTTLYQPEVTFGLLSVMTLMFFVGATGKSAQIPLYVWLPDAMEGPTPVSALIHAATMVTAGVYMIGRNADLFSLAPQTMLIVATIGALTALMAATIGLVQNDIKRVLAYSTVSQLGYMFLAMGVGAFTGGIFHLYTHAFFKALMFLGSGAVIHALHGEQDMRKMGGLKQHLPITFWTFLMGTIAIAGVPPLAGFFSKDEILWKTFESGHTVLWVVGMITAFLTATYMFRLLYMTFYCEPKWAHSHGHGSHGHGSNVDHAHEAHLHDAPPAMAIPLMILAVGAVLAGLVGVPHALNGSNRIEAFLEPSFHSARAGATMFPGSTHAVPSPQADVAPAAGDHAAQAAEPHGEMTVAPAVGGEHGLAPAGHGAEAAHADTATELGLMALSVVVALCGIGLATYFFKSNPQKADQVQQSFAGVHRVLLNKYYVDEFYDAVVVQPIKRTSERLLWKVVDAGVIDGAVNGTGFIVRTGGAIMRLVQTGSVRVYAASVFVGVLVVIGYYLAR